MATDLILIISDKSFIRVSLKRKFIDFIVDHDDDWEQVAASIFERLFVKKAKANMPVVVLVAGKSGRGKSWGTIRIMELIYKRLGVDFAPFLLDSIAFTPFDYARKFDAILKDKKFKDLMLFQIDEAREVVGARNWFNFINKSISDVLAMARAVKPVVVFIVTQSIKDVDKSIRRTIDYYAVFDRIPGERPTMKLFEVYMDETDIENPKLRKRRIKGIIRKDGLKLRRQPLFHFKKPSQSLIDVYEPMNYEMKAKIVRQKFELLIKQMEKEVYGPAQRMEALADFYLQRPDQLSIHISRTRTGKVKINPMFKKIHDLTNEEYDSFEKILTTKLITKGMASDVQKEI